MLLLPRGLQSPIAIFELFFQTNFSVTSQGSRDSYPSSPLHSFHLANNQASQPKQKTMPKPRCIHAAQSMNDNESRQSRLLTMRMCASVVKPGWSVDSVRLPIKNTKGILQQRYRNDMTDGWTPLICSFNFISCRRRSTARRYSSREERDRFIPSCNWCMLRWWCDVRVMLTLKY